MPGRDCGGCAPTLVFFLVTRRARGCTLFPYTTLFRSTTRPPGARSPTARGREEVSSSSSRLTTIRRRSEEHTSELQSLTNLVCRLLLEKKKAPQALRTARARKHTHLALRQPQLPFRQR